MNGRRARRALRGRALTTIAVSETGGVSTDF